MKIEILYPDVANLFGEKGHMDFFGKIFTDAIIYETHITEKPRFLEEDINLTYLGAMAEKYQEQIIGRWKPFKEDIRKRIEDGKFFFFTGNSMEILGEYIETDEGRIEALGIFPMHSKRQMMKRINCIYHGKYKDDIEVVGFKTQFTFIYPTGNLPPLFETLRGYGMNEGVSGEGIHYKNFFATSVVGPLLIQNPDFTKDFISNFDTKTEIPFYEDLKEAFEIRRKEFLDPKVHL